MQPSTIVTAVMRRVGISFFSYQQQLEPESEHPDGWPHKCFTYPLDSFVDQYELERDSRSDVTSNDASVKVNDTLDGAQAATVALAARHAGSCLLRNCRSGDGRRTLR